MRTHKFAGMALIMLILVFVSSCGGEYGKKVKINDTIDVYLKDDNVTEADAKKLGNFFAETWKDQKNHKSFQLSKENGQYIVRFSVDVEKVKNDKLIDVSFMAIQFLIESQAFPGSKVKLILTDDHFKDFKTFDGSSSKAKTDSLPQ